MSLLQPTPLTPPLLLLLQLPALWCGAADAQALEEWERFPLSGGLGTGVNVHVDILVDSLYKDLMRLDFERPNGDVPFRFFPRIDDERIDRLSILNGVEEGVQVWGGWPFSELTERVTLDFLKTKHHWAVWVNAQRTPWFDFPMRTADLVTHLRIYRGLSDPEVTLDKLLCTTPCDASECRDADGASTCRKDGQAVDATQCHSRQPTDSARHANCSVSEMTRQSGGNCCDGQPMDVNLAAAAPEDWVEVMDAEGFVGRSCVAFSLDEAGCKGLLGRPVRVDKVNSDARTLECWAPPAVSQTYPYYALVPHTPMIKDVAVTREQMNSLRNQFDYNTRLIKSSAGEVPQYWYAVAMHERSGVADAEPWVPVIQDRWDYWCDQAETDGVKLIVADVGADLIDYVTQCADLVVGTQAWVDRNGGSCAEHRSKGWCTPTGHETDAFRARSSRRQTFEAMEADGMYAPKACCGCGGGSLGGDLNELPPALTGGGIVVGGGVQAATVTK